MEVWDSNQFDVILSFRLDLYTDLSIEQNYVLLWSFLPK